MIILIIIIIIITMIIIIIIIIIIGGGACTEHVEYENKEWNVSGCGAARNIMRGESELGLCYTFEV
jgi:hypothetical protein